MMLNNTYWLTLMKKIMISASIICITNLYAQSSFAQPSVALSRDTLLKAIECIKKNTHEAVKATHAHPVSLCNTTIMAFVPNQYLLLQGKKMSDCHVNATTHGVPPTSQYIDLLVLPLTKVTGVEDQHRPNGIWQQAWTIAQSYLPDNGLIVLAANPRHYRTQDQLHIHILRQQPGIINYVNKLKPIYISSLSGAVDPVWAAAERHSNSHINSGELGIAVLFDHIKQKFAVVTSTDPTERTFGLQCPTTPH